MEDYDIINQQMDKFVKDFKRRFYNRYGIEAIVMYTEYSTKAKLTLIELEDILNKHLFTVVTIEDAPNGIKTRKRLRTISLHRQCFMYIAVSWVFPLVTIGRYLGGYSHATVLHGSKTVNNLIESRDAETMNLLIDIKNGIKAKLGHDGNVQFNIETKPEPQSVLSTLCPTGRSSHIAD